MSVKEKRASARATAEQARASAKRFGLRLQGATREGVVIVLLAACVFLLLALFSYQPADPGWSHRGPETSVSNWMGPIGAWLADVLYSLFGASALWWPGMLGFAGWWLVRSRQVRFEWDATALAVRLGGLVLLLLGTTTLGALHFYHPESRLPYASGGILGEGLVGALVPLVDTGGTGLLAVAAMLCGFPLFSGLSWLSVMDDLGHGALRLWRWVAVPFGLARERRAARRSEAGAETEAAVDESQEEAAEAPASDDEASRRGWRRWLPGRRAGAASREPALHAGAHDAGYGDDGDTEIPWEVPERTPSAKQPAAAYAVRQERTAEAAAAVEPREPVMPSLSARRDEPDPAAEAMPLSAREPESSAIAADPGSAAPLEPAAPKPTAPKPEAASRPGRGERREPGVGDWQPTEPDVPDNEPRLRWDAMVDEPPSGAEASAPAPHAGTPFAPPEPSESEPDTPPEPQGAGDQAAGLRTWRETAAAHDGAPSEAVGTDNDENRGRMATAEQARTAAHEPEGPALWTVEHLQSQRPVLDGLPEPDGKLPSLRLLTPPEPHQQNYSEAQLAEMAELLETRLREYGVKAEVVHTWPGPVITRFEIKPAAGVKVSKISNLAKDLARSLMVKSVRVVEVIPGRPTVGIEIPNPHRAMIRLREVIDSDRYQEAASALTLALGQDIGGGPVVANLGKMPHLLVAGTTGSGKSVGVNAMLISMLLKATPDELRLIMVDPKMLELSVYDGIPHLLAPVVTDMKEAANGLRWCVAEMERRYKLMAAMGVRNIAGFNAKLDEAERAGAQVADPLWEPQPWQMHEHPPVLEKLPYIVVVIDEFADMFMIVGKKVEELIARLAQKARAAGIHLILATQRPSVDVVTGLIKANIPTRMAFQVSSKVDSRTILDQGGAENLLGHGDMLYLPAGAGLPTRVHGAFVDDDEVHRVVEDWKRRGEPEYIDEILSGGVSAEALTGLEAEGGGEGDDAEQDALYDEAVAFVTESRRASISAVQRRFKIGYNRAARLVEAMEAAGVVSSMGTNGAREVLAPPPAGD
ncbi:DNA translocase FtsK [Halomonas sp. NO4]|uniref:DNA translocase FtsK n=1 Tax=Halomonas sp. NO4 TaxID=2484813 RepID=UPI001F088992|nr:DNA translocase FtsK [Halomonas sp. NO4]